MAELNLKQITDKLNSEFVGDVRKLVFWYDAGAEFIQDIDTIALENAKVLKLEQDNQFYMKYFLEREDTTTHYLIYAPFAEPALKDNHLADTVRYSKEFFADRASLLALDLGIDEKYKPVLQQYLKFFGAKDRTQRFYELEIENFNKTVIETALMSVICKTKVVSFEEIVRTVITDDNLEDNKYMAEFEKYDLVQPFWQMCEETFGYTDVSPTLFKLIATLFITYTSKVIQSELPNVWKIYNSYKSGNSIAFLDGLMNSVIFKSSFERLSDLVFSTLDGETIFNKLQVNDLTEVEIFKKVDIFLMKWLLERLENEDTDAKLNGYSIPELCKMRRKMHYGQLFYSHYYILENAYHLIVAARFETKTSATDLWKSYIETDYVIDQKYRYFYYHYDTVIDHTPYENLRDIVENIYTNRYLDPLSVSWIRAFSECKGYTGLIKQQDFYQTFVRHTKERVVVIISDALRFEVGQTLLKRLMADEKCTATIHAMQSVVPSYTRFGMSALLPHKELSMSKDFKVLVDGKICDDLKTREQVLQKTVQNSRTVQFDDIKTMKVADLKDIFTGQEVVYVYHNQIDARGDKLNTENEVFNACEEALEEIHTMIKRLTSANNTRFIVTADHGFIYKRDKLAESDKISGFEKSNAFIGRRYVIADESLQTDGVGTIQLGEILANTDERIISVPIGSDVFKVAGGGQNYVHGGASLQEVLIPVLDVKTNKYHTATRSVTIALVSGLSKITNLATNLDFIQMEAVTDVNKETTYKLFFISDDNEKISSENIYVADKKDRDASKRVFRLKFTFKNKKYDKHRKYYLVAYDEKNALEVIRHEVQMDLAFSDDFGF
ncbi:BREX-1 system phosphatase PglZ type A [Peribacillus sp. FSL K6-1552]|uniref:BREX-1 system phosphatase PglZ type A n=1 Tax=Peribacillus sp. FSL K6-1552 TaxID=2954514 RepID=UPI0030F87B91